MPYLPVPKGIDLCFTKVLRLQSTLFIMGWMGKFFAGAAYFFAGRTHAVAMAICALAALFSVFVIGVIYRKMPTKEEQIAKLKEELAKLEPPPAQPAENNEINPMTSPIYPLYSKSGRRF